jgi:hypothetical protein
VVHSAAQQTDNRNDRTGYESGCSTDPFWRPNWFLEASDCRPPIQDGQKLRHNMVEEPKTTPLQPEILTRQIPSGELPIYFVKGNFYRVIHADGIYGGGSPTVGSIVMTVYSHRIPLPEKTVNDVSGKEIPEKRVVKYGIENELEASIVMDLNTAKIMQQWLSSTIKNVEDLMQRVHQPGQVK